MADDEFMQAAIDEARAGLAEGGIPIGSVLVHEGRIIGRGHNRRETDHDPFAHAELLAMREAALHLKSWRLTNVTVYVTLEPCAMCAGAMVQARLGAVVFGADDPKQGRADLLVGHNHSVKVTRGVEAEQASSLLKDFFARLCHS